MYPMDEIRKKSGNIIHCWEETHKIESVPRELHTFLNLHFGFVESG